QTAHPRARRTLHREVAALAGNLHPGLPRLLADGSAADEPYVVLEYVDGPTLADEVDDNGAFAPDDVAVLGAQLLSALLALHARGLAHLDLKPDNVALCHGRPVLLDFGSTRALGSGQPSGRPIGSPGYAAPELEAGAPIHPAMDLYGLGATLHELLAGAPTFAPELAAAARPAAPPVPPSPLTPTVQALLAPDPALRPDAWTTLRALGRSAAATGREVWPGWADSYLPT
ncbi:MAG TPA: protein kinase, partial [Jatrophihabitans sp.]|nr:protein kinase [Jatrophihabitans sp.]